MALFKISFISENTIEITYKDKSILLNCEKEDWPEESLEVNIWKAVASKVQRLPQSYNDFFSEIFQKEVLLIRMPSESSRTRF
jgi:hypothetical protein